MRKLEAIPTTIVFVLGMTALLWSFPPESGQQGASAPVDSPAASSRTVPVMDGGAGPCSLDLSVMNDGKPVPAADVKVHISYGFAGIRRLDLEAYTGNDGKVKFTGLPSRVHQPPLEFRASKDMLAGVAVYNPQTECHAQHEITLVQQKNDQN
jgi:hypothetical protein